MAGSGCTANWANDFCIPVKQQYIVVCRLILSNVIGLPRLNSLPVLRVAIGTEVMGDGRINGRTERGIIQGSLNCKVKTSSLALSQHTCQA